MTEETRRYRVKIVRLQDGERFALLIDNRSRFPVSETTRYSAVFRRTKEGSVSTTRNDWQRELFNGSLGRLVRVDGTYDATVAFDGTEHRLDRDDLDALALAYCITIHKAQGSQFRRVVIPVIPSRLLDRTLLYTAVTRAVEQVVLVGDRKAFKRAIAAPPAPMRRDTGLSFLL